MKPPNDESGDLALVRAVIRGDEGAWEEFVRRYSEIIYSLCHSIFSADNEHEEYLNILARLRADDFAILRVYNGRAKLSTYLTLKIADIVANRLVELFREDRNRAWEAFERFYEKHTLRIINRYFRFLARQGGALADGSTYSEDHYVFLTRRDANLASTDSMGGGRPCDCVIPAWSAGIEIDTDIPRRFQWTWMPAIHAGMTEPLAMR